MSGVEVPAAADAGPTVILQGRSVSRTFAAPGMPSAGPALTNVSVTINEGDRLGIIGPSGSGKSTLLAVLLGLDTGADGEVLFRGAPIAAATRERTRSFRQQVQYVPQHPGASLVPRLTVRQSLAEPLRSLRVSGDWPAMMRRALREVALAEAFLDRRVTELSGGQAQRVAIARALVTGPRVLIADEPTSGLDLPLRQQVLELFGSLCADRSMALVLVSHDLSAVSSVCDRLIVLSEGKVVEQGPAAELLRRSRSPVTRQLIDAIPRLSRLSGGVLDDVGSDVVAEPDRAVDMLEAFGRQVAAGESDRTDRLQQ